MITQLTAPLERLHHWAEQGWLRRLDSAFAAFLLELDPAARPALLLSAAVLSHLEGRGHTCLPLADLVAQPLSLLGWPAEATEPLTNFAAELPHALDAWLQDLQASPLVRFTIGAINSNTLDQGQPLVLGGNAQQPLLYLRRYWLHEQQVMQHIVQRTQTSVTVNHELARQWLDALFDNGNPTEKPDEFDWQKFACAVALRAQLSIITGGPGTGKTYTAARLLALLFAMHSNEQSLRVALAAPTGKAAARLRQSIDTSLQELCQRLGTKLDLPDFLQRMGAAKTLHSLLGARTGTRALLHNAHRPLDVDVLIVDEASMIHLEMMSALLQALPQGAKLILLGDKDQLASVEAGAVLGDLCMHATAGHYSPATANYAQRLTGKSIPEPYLCKEDSTQALPQQTVMLRKSKRFGGLIGQLATAINQGNSALCSELLAHDTSGTVHASHHSNTQALVQICVQGRTGAEACFADYLRIIKNKPEGAQTHETVHTQWVASILRTFDRFRVLCAVREGDWGTQVLNQAIQLALAQSALLNPRGEWYVGRPIMVTRNDAQLGILNGDVGITLPSMKGYGHLRVYFLDGDALRSVSVSRLSHVETAFAMTVHKSQGSEFLHTALILPPGGGKLLTRELVYTGVTRAREKLTLIEGQVGVMKDAILRTSDRHSGLGMQLSRSAFTVTPEATLTPKSLV